MELIVIKWYLNSTIFYAFFKGKLRFENVKTPEGLVKFQESVERKMYNKDHLEKYLVVSNKKGKAVIGCGHFMATFRAEVFQEAPSEVCKFKIVGGSENNYLDKPNDKGGYLRLSTLKNYGYHLGNKEENWMYDKLKNINNSKIDWETVNSLPELKSIGTLGYKIGRVIHVLFFKKFKKVYFGFKGMKNLY